MKIRMLVLELLHANRRGVGKRDLLKLILEKGVGNR